ncbi:hypothetical protein [Alteribacter aurantiacus]|uniref:hypothetical protein n=1 Tax=Alteribacter aurantiacus TaxID=254410 RepID=UPI0004098499|nr:hypothetical protein [Alteribacter aurantiacus]
MREIGSEFWSEDNLNDKSNGSFHNLINFGDDKKLLFSGRTAIDYVLEDISKPIKKVYMPSYCCASMIQPFNDRDIDVEYYDVISDREGLKYKINYDTDIDVFFANSYFGYEVTAMDFIIEEFKGRNIIVIEDITHRLLSEKNFCEKADYIVASLRKWFPIPSGGLAVKLKGYFKEIRLLSPSTEIVDKKIEAMSKKAAFMSGLESNNTYSEHEKSNFLKLFAEFNKSLHLEYKNIKIDDTSADILSRINIFNIQKRRRENSKYIHDALNHSKNIGFLITEPNFSRDCPLFVPIMVRAEKRDEVRKHLIKNDIFCPVHWPIPNDDSLGDSTVQIYNEELSLICDQRYGHDDVKRIITALGEYIDIL